MTDPQYRSPFGVNLAVVFLGSHWWLLPAGLSGFIGAAGLATEMGRPRGRT